MVSTETGCDRGNGSGQWGVMAMGVSVGDWRREEVDGMRPRGREGSEAAGTIKLMVDTLALAS